MNLTERIGTARKIFLDTAPVIYFVEKNPNFVPDLHIIFQKMDEGELSAVISPITLAECLVLPYKLGKSDLAKSFLELLTDSDSVLFYPSDEMVADKAAELRARYNLTLADAFQLATALRAGCDAFLTNDTQLKRVEEIPVLVLAE